MAEGHGAFKRRHREQPLRDRELRRVRVVRPRLESDRSARQEGCLFKNAARVARLHAERDDGGVGARARHDAPHSAHHPETQAVGERDRGHGAARAQAVHVATLARRLRAHPLLRVRLVRRRRPLRVRKHATARADARTRGGAHLHAAVRSFRVSARPQPVPPRLEDGEHLSEPGRRAVRVEGC